MDTTWHSVCEIYFSFTCLLTPSNFQSGTCAMKPREQGGVVDERLNVYGVQNLKIAGNYPTTFDKNLIHI